MTRIRPIKIRSTEISAPLKVTAKVDSYELYSGVSREGKHYEEDRIFFTLDGVPRFLVLNNSAIVTLAQKGFMPTEDGLTEQLPGSKLFFELQKPKGSFNYYRLTKVVRPK